MVNVHPGWNHTVTANVQMVIAYASKQKSDFFLGLSRSDIKIRNTSMKNLRNNMNTIIKGVRLAAC